MNKVPWYNTTICSKLNNQIFKDYFKTGGKDSYALMCAVGAYYKEHVSILDDAINGSGIPMPSMSYK